MLCFQHGNYCNLSVSVALTVQFTTNGGYATFEPFWCVDISVTIFLYINNYYLCLLKLLYRQAQCYGSWC